MPLIDAINERLIHAAAFDGMGITIFGISAKTNHHVLARTHCFGRLFGIIIGQRLEHNVGINFGNGVGDLIDKI